MIETKEDIKAEFELKTGRKHTWIDLGLQDLAYNDPYYESIGLRGWSFRSRFSQGAYLEVADRSPVVHRQFPPQESLTSERVKRMFSRNQAFYSRWGNKYK